MLFRFAGPFSTYIQSRFNRLSMFAVLLIALAQFSIPTWVHARDISQVIDPQQAAAILSFEEIPRTSLSIEELVRRFDAPRARHNTLSDQPVYTAAKSGDDELWSDAFASPVVVEDGVDGTVWAMLEYGDKLIVAGDFTRAGNLQASNIAMWDGTTWNTMASGFDGIVFALIEYEGELIAAGSFNSADGRPTGNVARWDGDRWRGLDHGLDGAARALVIHNHNLIVGGDFETAGRSSARKIARWNGKKWSAIGDGFSGGFANLGVRSLVVHAGQLVAGGFFKYSGDQPVHHIAGWDGSHWSQFGNWTDDTVYSLISHASSTSHGSLVAGSVVWRQGPGQWTNLIRRWDGNAWHTFGEGALDQPYPNAVRAFVATDDALIISGQFVSAAGVVVNYVVGQKNGAWESIAGGTNAPVYAVAMFRGVLYAGGEFTSAGGTATNSIARWDGTDWNALGGGFTSGLGVNGTIWDFHRFGDELIVGGGFTRAGGVSANHVAAFDGAAWRTLGDGFNGNVATFLEYEDQLIAAGLFTASGATRVAHIARWNGSEWLPLGAGLNGMAVALTVFEGELIVGGDFSLAGEIRARQIAAWDGSSWRALGEGFSRGFRNLGVRSLAVFEGELFAGGHFLQSGDESTRFIARWNDDKWLSVGEDGLIGTAYALIARKRKLVVGSVVWSEGTGLWENLVRQYAPWQSLGSGELVAPFPNAARAFAEHDGMLVLAGQFPDAADRTVNYLAQHNGRSHGPGKSRWEGFGSGLNGPAYAVESFNGSLFVGGEFTTAGGKPASRIARWDGHEEDHSIRPSQRDPEAGKNNTTGLTRINTDFKSNKVSIAFDVTHAETMVEINVYNARGHRVRSLTRSMFNVGSHSVVWNLSDASSVPVSRGVYFVTFRAAGLEQSKKLVLIRN